MNRYVLGRKLKPVACMGKVFAKKILVEEGLGGYEYAC
jgi:hypothetical protein